MQGEFDFVSKKVCFCGELFAFCTHYMDNTLFTCTTHSMGKLSEEEKNGEKALGGISEFFDVLQST